MFHTFQQIHATERDFVSACTLLGAGADYSAAAKSEYTQLLFLLSKGMVGLLSKNLNPVLVLMSELQIETELSIYYM